MLHSIFQDFQFALRTFRRSPGFTFAVLFTLALGIGANTAIFSVVDGALLHPVPFPDSDRLASLYQTFPQGGDKNAISYPNLSDWQQQSQTFEAIAGVRGETFTLISVRFCGMQFHSCGSYEAQNHYYKCSKIILV